MKKKEQKKFTDITKLLFTISYIVITLTALVFTLVICAKPFKITDYDDLKQVNLETYNTQKPEEYFVFVYGDDEAANEWYIDLVTQYANKARTTSTVIPMYGYDSSIKSQAALVKNLSLSNVPALLHIKSGNVSKKYTSWADIRNTLAKAIENPIDPHEGHNH